MKNLEKQVDELKRERDALLRINKSKAFHQIKASKKIGGSEATVITILSDVHYEESVRSKSVFNRNEYDLNIASKRLNEYFARVARLTAKEQNDVTIKEGVMFLGGDFISGRIHEELLENCQLRPIDSILQVMAHIDGGIQFLLDNTNLKWTFVCSCGNHGRISKKTHFSTEQGNNLEWFMYHKLADKYKGNPRITFVTEPSYHTYLIVYDKVLRFHHGHAVKYWGGIGGLTIPLNKAIAQWNTVYRADFDFLGHHHQHMVHSNFVVNGSVIGYNAYSIAIKAPYERPKQAFVLLDRDRGISVSMPIMFSV